MPLCVLFSQATGLETPLANFGTVSVDYINFEISYHKIFVKY